MHLFPPDPVQVWVQDQVELRATVRLDQRGQPKASASLTRAARMRAAPSPIRGVTAGQQRRALATHLTQSIRAVVLAVIRRRGLPKASASLTRAARMRAAPSPIRGVTAGRRRRRQALAAHHLQSIRAAVLAVIRRRGLARKSGV